MKRHCLATPSSDSAERDFLPPSLHEFAYEDAALMIDEERTLPQPYLVALMAEALSIRGHAKVLEIGTGSGYATAVLSRLAAKVYSVESNAALAAKAAAILRNLECPHVRIVHANANLGLPEHGPFDAIFVNPGGAEFVGALKPQLAMGGRMVVSAGTDPAVRELIRVTRTGPDDFTVEDMADVRVAPLDVDAVRLRARLDAQPPTRSADALTAQAIANACERFDSIESADLAPLLARIGDARIVLLGEATHGTSEFYRMRERISRELIERKGFNFIAIEADWPDASRIDRYVRHAGHRPSQWSAFARFPVWMWRNQEVRKFVDWLRAHNAEIAERDRVAFHGLERYYRTMYYGSRASWNLRDSHMFDTLQSLLDFHGARSKAIVWAHNSHIGDCMATEMSRRGEHNIGQLCRMMH